MESFSKVILFIRVMIFIIINIIIMRQGCGSINKLFSADKGPKTNFTKKLNCFFIFFIE